MFIKIKKGKIETPTVKHRVFTPPNFFLGLMRVAAWVFWRDPVKPEPPQPKRPRKPTLGYTVGDIPYELMAVVRISWYRKGMAYEVEEYQIEESDDADKQFRYVVGTALRQGADVCVLTQYQPEALGVQQ
jgi:hypothetical protein